MTELTLVSALLVGLLGSSHCLAMCGGLSSALGVAGPIGLRRYVVYNLGRISSYGLIGAVLGLMGQQILEIAPQLGLFLRGLAGLLLIAMGLYVSQWWMGLTRLEAFGARLWTYIQPLTASLLPVKNNWQALKLGSLWGFLPCGLVYSTLAWALAAAHWQQSAMLMIAFGVGTLPAMLSIGFMNEKILSALRSKQFRRVAGLLIIVLGVVTMLSPWQHVGGHHEQHIHGNTQSYQTDDLNQHSKLHSD